MRNKVAQCVYEYCKKDPKGFLISGDAGFGVWEKLREEMPEQYINTGINESASVGLAAGMALSGHKVFMYNIIPFLLYRCYEQVRVDIGYQNLPVMLLGIGSGLTYAPAGMTHYSVEDIGLAATIPNIRVFSPADKIQAEAAFGHAIKSDCPVYIRLSKAGEPEVTKNREYAPHYLLKGKGSGNAMVFHGSIAPNVLKAHEILESRSLDMDLYSVLQVLPFDGGFLEKYENIFVVEEHFSYGGLATIIKDKADGKVYPLGIENSFIHEIGDAEYVRAKYGLTAEMIADRITEILSGE